MFNKILTLFTLVLMLSSCQTDEKLAVEVFETAASGNKLTQVAQSDENTATTVIRLSPENRFQTITGFGGSFTEASASLLNRVSAENRKKVLQAYFGPDGARYSLTRTHMNSCDFSLSNYSYAPLAGDVELQHFSIDEDRDDL
ncbi:MAG: glycosyl hydrolase family 30, partial [Robiginitalea sp.]